jgi:hypothetical protein
MRQTRIERVTFRLPRILDRTELLQSDALPTELLALVMDCREECHIHYVDVPSVVRGDDKPGASWFWALTAFSQEEENVTKRFGSWRSDFTTVA